MSNSNSTFAFIGAGNMSGAIIEGMVSNGFAPEQIYAVNRSAEKQQALKDKLGIHTEFSAAGAIAKSDTVVLGVKPQMMLELLSNLVEQGVNFENKLVITVAAGLTCERYTDIIGKVRFVRTMPNTPSQVGLGVAGLYMDSDEASFSAGQLEQDKQTTASIFNAVGKSIWLKSEQQIDQLTAVSGSGPAYFFLFMELMAAKAKEMGFDEEAANLMVQQTALGASQMAVDANGDFAQLRINVTSPGGTTAAALDVFKNKDLAETINQALDANVNRSQELSKI